MPPRFSQSLHFLGGIFTKFETPAQAWELVGKIPLGHVAENNYFDYLHSHKNGLKCPHWWSLEEYERAPKIFGVFMFEEAFSGPVLYPYSVL